MNFVLHSELLAKNVCTGSYVKADFDNTLEAKLYKITLNTTIYYVEIKCQLDETDEFLL